MANDSLVDVILERFPEEADDVMALYRYLYAKKMLLYAMQSNFIRFIKINGHINRF